MTVRALDPESLCRRCDPDRFSFQTTDELEDLQEIVGQPRAVAAMRFGINMGRDGYNVYALGPTGTGKHTLARRFVEEKAASEPVPMDVCYVYNFEAPHRPRALRLPPGTAVQLRDDMRRLVEDVRTTLMSAFESDEFRTRRQVIEEEFRERQERAFGELRERARERGLALLRTPVGLVFAPLRADGEVMPPEEFQKLPQEEQKRLEAEIEQLQNELQKIIMEIPRWEREMNRRIRELGREFTNFAVRDLMDEMRQKYASLPDVVSYLDAVQADIVENVRSFLRPDGGAPQDGAAEPMAVHAWLETPFIRRYRVNVLVDHSQSQGAPVVYEDNPTYLNLVGRIEHMAQMGALVTDFTLIKPGALHRANGGYLILDVRKVLSEPYAWEGLKRALQSRRITIESPGQLAGLVTTISLEPEPIPLDVKVILLGDRLLYYLLQEYDPDFSELFKVAADFEEEVDRTEETELLYARLIATMARREGLRPFDRTGVARVIDHCARMAEDAEKLSTRMREVVDLLREADYWAGEAGKAVVDGEAVEQAIAAQIYRSDRLRERLQEEILRDTIFIDTDGAKVGQVNGLSVIDLGGFRFGRPSRITARVRLGRGEVIDIEREVEMGGPIHSKGVLILSSFLGARYAAERPLSLSASLVFEQSYSGVEGDSASSAELYALLSAIAEVPIKQSLAVTGSVNQHGQIQAIGGVNEKIEGFFDICKARGLTGEQGVIIPAANVKHLMLRRDVVEAVREGKFHIYAVETVDEGIELLTGLPAGERDEEGLYPEGSINALVEARLEELARRRQEYSQAGDEEE